MFLEHKNFYKRNYKLLDEIHNIICEIGDGNFYDGIRPKYEKFRKRFAKRFEEICGVKF